jgi:hypothetical protein
MKAALGDDLVATLVAPSPLPAYPMGARIEVPYTREILAYWRPAVLDGPLGIWTVAFADSPLIVGEYNLVWRDSGPEPPELEVMIPLAIGTTLGSATGGVLPPGGPYDWAPTVEEIAEVTPAYTAGGFDDDRVSAGAGQTNGGVPTYTADTTPTLAHVEGLIVAACDEIAGRVGVGIAESQYGLAKATAKWHVAAAIAAGKQPAGTDDASGEYRAHIANFRNSLDALVVLARGGGVGAGASRLH